MVVDFQCKIAVWSSGTSIALMPVSAAVRPAGRAESLLNSQLNRTSLAVKGWPSCHFTFLRKFHVWRIVPSELITHVPSSTEGRRSASMGMTFASWSSMLIAEWAIAWRSPPTSPEIDPMLVIVKGAPKAARATVAPAERSAAAELGALAWPGAVEGGAAQP